MQNQKIQQGSKEWLQAKLTTIGGSEIYALVLGLCTLEEIQAVLPHFNLESAFTSPMLCAFKFLYGQHAPMKASIDNILKYGNAMEEPSVSWFNKQYSGVAKCNFTRDFEVHKKNRHASCSPDGYISLNGTVRDFATGETITREDGVGVMEIKTIRRDQGFKDEPKMQYIFQACWNAYIMNMQWFCIFSTYAKEYSLETEFYQGRRVAYAETNQYQKIYQELSSKTFFYKINGGIINLCLTAFKRFLNKVETVSKASRTGKFQAFLDNFEFSKREDISALERSMVLQICSSQYTAEYGDAEATEEQSSLLLRRYELSQQEKAIKEEKDEIAGQFIKMLGKHNAIVSYETETVPEMRCSMQGGSLKFTPNFSKDKFAKAFGGESLNFDNHKNINN